VNATEVRAEIGRLTERKDGGPVKPSSIIGWQEMIEHTCQCGAKFRGGRTADRSSACADAKTKACSQAVLPKGEFQ
jgi:hypothetical protein